MLLNLLGQILEEWLKANHRLKGDMESSHSQKNNNT